MLNGQWLETFVVPCETGHFTKAAARLAMTQPGVSQHLKKLEEQVGHPLIARDGKKFTLTPAGEVVLSFGRKRCDAERELMAALDADDAGQGQVSVACSGSIAMLVYARLIELMAASPNLLVHLEGTPQSRVMEGILSGAFDIGIVDHEPQHPRLEGDLIGSDELCLVMPGGHSPKPIFADLERLGFIAHPDGFSYADELLSVNFPEEYQGVDRLRIRSVINQIGQIPEPVSRGVGYTILPRSGIDAYVRHEMLTCIKLRNPIRHELWLVRRRGRILPARALRVREEVTGAVQALMQRQGLY